MIPFLVKLANLLDKRGQYAMAREVDDLIVKLAQQTVVSPAAWAQQQAELQKLFTARSQMLVNPQANAEKIKQLEDQIRKFDGGQLRRPLNQEEQAAWSNAGKPEGNEFNTWYSSYQAEKQRQEAAAAEAAKPYGPPTLEQMSTEEINQAVQNELAKLTPSQQAAWKKAGEPMGKEFFAWREQLKAPAKKPARKNPQIIQIQKNLGVKQTGTWDSETNKAFVAAMNSLPAYAKMMRGGKFNGTLQDAVRYTTQLSTYKGLDTGAKDEDGTPVAEDFTPSKAPAYKSHYDLLDIQDTIRKLVAAGYGESIQALIV